jgi:hypothetical protein
MGTLYCHNRYQLWAYHAHVTQKFLGFIYYHVPSNINHMVTKVYISACPIMDTGNVKFSKICHHTNVKTTVQDCTKIICMSKFRVWETEEADDETDECDAE